MSTIAEKLIQKLMYEKLLFDIKKRTVAGTKQFYVMWHCPTCKSTLTSGDWYDSEEFAKSECLEGVGEHMAKYHPDIPMPS